MSQYYSLVTQAGFAAEANAKGLGQKVNISEFAIGDSNGSEYDPEGTETALKNEVYRGAVNNIIYDPANPNQFIIEGVVPQNIGGFTVREAAVYTEKGVLYGIAKLAPSYKTTVDSGASSELKLRVVFGTSNSSTINLVIDPSGVLATREYVDSNSLFVEVESNMDAIENKEHIFLAGSDLKLKVLPDGNYVDVVVDASVDLETAECRVLPPDGEQISAKNALHSISRVTKNSIPVRFRRIKGVWKI